MLLAEVAPALNPGHELEIPSDGWRLDPPRSEPDILESFLQRRRLDGRQRPKDRGGVSGATRHSPGRGLEVGSLRIEEVRSLAEVRHQLLDHFLERHPRGSLVLETNEA